MEKVRTIIWDLDGTVWSYRENEPSILCDFLNIHDKERFAKEFGKMWENLSLQFKEVIVTHDNVENFIEKQIPVLKLYNVSALELIQALCDKKRYTVTPNEDAIEMLKYFYEKGFKNISITDWFAMYQQKSLEEFNALGYIEKIYGCDNTYFKDSKAKANEISKELNIDDIRKEEFVIIGDSLSCDIFFAQNLGIKSIWYNPQRKKNNTNNIPTLEVQSFLELKTIF